MDKAHGILCSYVLQMIVNYEKYILAYEVLSCT